MLPQVPFECAQPVETGGAGRPGAFLTWPKRRSNLVVPHFCRRVVLLSLPGKRPRIWGPLLLIGLISFSPAMVRAQTKEQQPTVLHLTQTAERRVVRDLLRVELRAEETGADPVALQSAINRRMARALDRAHQLQGIGLKPVIMQLTRNNHRKARHTGAAANRLILTGKAADALLKLAGTLQSDGLLMSSLGYEVSPETLRGTEEDLTAEALAGLDHRAASVAERMHLSVLRYRDLRVGNAETGTGPFRASPRWRWRPR